MAATDSMTEIWKASNMGAAYRPVEVVTGPFAKHLVEQSGITSSSTANQNPLKILDQACGTGVIAVALHEALDHKEERNWHLTCADISESMLGVFRERINEMGWKNTDIALSDIQKSGFPSSTFSHVFGSFVFMALSNSEAALDESLRVLKPGGTIAINSWKLLPWIPDVNQAIASLSEDLPQVTFSRLCRSMSDGEWENPSWVETQLQNRKLEDVQVNVVSKMLEAGTVKEFGQAFLPASMVITDKLWTEEQRDQHGDGLIPAITQYLENKYGEDQITMTWEAIIITARKPL